MNSQSLRDQKSAFRSGVLAKRDALDETTRIEYSLLAAEHGEKLKVFADDKFMPGTIVSGFFPIRSEIDTRPLMAKLARLGARLCLPVVTDKTTIEFRELVRGAPMVDGGFGTVGPDEHAEILNPEILLLPLSAFDDHGGRIGYGAGHYDRAIERLVERNIEPRLIGMAYALQQVEKVPTEPHDRNLEGVITEAGYIAAKGHMK